MTLRVLAVGDVVGAAGRRMCADLLGPLRDETGADLVVVNGENASGGFGITPENAYDILEAGADVITLGDHWFDHRGLAPVLDDPAQPILRPANLPEEGVPGRGVWTGEAGGARIRLVVFQGRIFMREGADNPFAAADHLLEDAHDDEIVLAEVHAEATSEKQAMFWHLDGRAAAAWGTHTHVQTADARLFPRGLAAITDLGMTGARDSVIGFDVEAGLSRFKTGITPRLKPPRSGPAALCGALFTIDPATRRAVEVVRVRRESDLP